MFLRSSTGNGSLISLVPYNRCYVGLASLVTLESAVMQKRVAKKGLWKLVRLLGQVCPYHWFVVEMMSPNASGSPLH